MLQNPKHPTEAMIYAGMIAMRSVSKLGARKSTAKVVWLAMETQRLADADAERRAATQARLAENIPWAATGAPPVRLEPSPATPAPQPSQTAPAWRPGDAGWRLASDPAPSPRQRAPWHVAGDFGR